MISRNRPHIDPNSSVGKPPRLSLVEYYIQSPDGKKVVVTYSGNTQDIIREIIKTYQVTFHTIKDFAKTFNTGDLVSTCRQIHTWIYTNIQYKEDEDGEQLIPSPARVLVNKYSDCKGFAILTGSILRQLEIPFYFRFVKYPDSRNPNMYSHIYVVVPSDQGYYVIDPTHPEFHGEYEFHKEPLDIPGNTDPASINGPIGGFFDRVGDWFKDTFSNTGQRIKTGTLTPMRLAFLVLVKINFLAIASRLAAGLDTPEVARAKGWSQDFYNRAVGAWNEFSDKWYKWGGNRTSLKNAVLSARDKRAIFGKKYDQYIKGVPGIGDGVVEAIVAALPLLIQILAIFTKRGLNDPNGDLPEGYDPTQDLPNYDPGKDPLQVKQGIGTGLILLLGIVALSNKTKPSKRTPRSRRLK